MFTVSAFVPGTVNMKKRETTFRQLLSPLDALYFVSWRPKTASCIHKK